ncbi:hypothetical protein CBL_06366 [Carabus blaptoides fortunei]
MTADITEFASKSYVCQSQQRYNDREPIKLHRIPDYPWQIVATDLFEIKLKTYVLLVDTYTSFYDFREISTTATESVIECLKIWFAIFSTPEEVLLDNGPQYSWIRHLPTGCELKSFEMHQKRLNNVMTTTSNSMFLHSTLTHVVPFLHHL